MDIYRFIHIVIRKIKYIIIIPILAGVLMYILSFNQALKYSARASIFTAITSKSSLNDLGNSRVDFFATKTAYNNLLSILTSQSVMEETSLRLLASHLVLDKPNPAEISVKSFEELEKNIPKQIYKLVDKENKEKTYLNMLTYMQQEEHNFLYGLLNLDHPHYSYKAISKIKAVQAGSSDIIELSYQSDDPAIAYQTLNILIGVFLDKYSRLKKNQTNAVVEYFEKQLEKSSVKLNSAEDSLLRFNKSNNIINYYEQTKHISSQQEKIEVKLQDIMLEYRAAEAVLEKLEDETRSRFNINLKNSEIMDIRKSLISVNQKLAKLEIYESESLLTSSTGLELTQMKRNLKLGLQGKLDSLYIFEHNSEGIDIEILLNDWLKTVIEYESAKARLLAMQIKSKDFKELYTQYAPLGAILKRIEREIEVKEKEYLEILHHLGLAKLKQQNEEMMANMKVLDKPQMPINPEPTKRKLYTILISLFSFFFTLLGIVLYELLDKTVKTIKHYADLSGLKISGAVVLEKKYHNVNIHNLSSKGLKQIVESIIKLLSSRKTKDPVIVQIFSNWSSEGKSYVLNLINTQLRKAEYASEVIHVTTRDKPENINILLKETLTKASYMELAAGHVHPDTEIILIEIPAISEELFNTNLFSTSSLSYFITDANRVWSLADKFLLDNLNQQTNYKLQGILNKVFPDDMEEIAGEILKKRSKIRKFVKRHIFKRLIV